MWNDFMEIVNNTLITPYTVMLRLSLSFLLGAVIGIERQLRRREAGMRTFTLICMGSTAAMLISIWIPQTYPNLLNGDPGRVAAQVLTGIGEACRGYLGKAPHEMSPCECALMAGLPNAPSALSDNLELAWGRARLVASQMRKYEMPTARLVEGCWPTA